jgi:hypothetical protein
MDRSEDAPLNEQLHVLRNDAPQRYALLERHFVELEHILEQSPRNYASAKQLYAVWEDPSFQPQILGQLLSAIADLGVLRVHTRRSNCNRYGLTAYDPTRMQELAVVFVTETEPANTQPSHNQ